MRPRFCFPIVLSLLGGCAALPQWADLPVFASVSGSAGSKPSTISVEPGRFSFDWILSGDRDVAPLQVFDDGKRVWLQFHENEPVPALFERTERGDRPLAWRRESAYVVLDGIFDHLVFRGGHLMAQAQREQRSGLSGASGQDQSVGQSSSVQAVSVPEISADDPASVPVGRHALVPDTATMLKPSVALSVPQRIESSSDVHIPGLPVVPSPVVPSPVLPAAPPSPAFAAGPDDGTLRGALARWSRLAGWTFEPEHWAVEVDVPLGASADFPSHFVEAVQALVAATELSERPLQPCFYSNRVLRVVPYAQACDRSARGVSGVPS